MRGSIRLSGSSNDSPWTFARRLAKSRTIKDARKAVMTSFPLPGLPLRVRPALVVLCALSLLVLSLLGFHPTLARRIQPPVPFSDKILHFVCFALASSLFYAIWTVEPEARASQPWKNWPEYSSVGVCMLAGGVGSEFVQALLPYKEFQWLDVVANLLGSAIGIATARNIAIEHRKKREIRRLYAPIDERELAGLAGSTVGGGIDREASSDEDDEDIERDGGVTNRDGTRRRLDVWNADADSLFELGDADLEDDIENTRRNRAYSVNSLS